MTLMYFGFTRLYNAIKIYNNNIPKTFNNINNNNSIYSQDV